jgi:hypothetical protein
MQILQSDRRTLAIGEAALEVNVSLFVCAGRMYQIQAKSIQKTVRVVE